MKVDQVIRTTFTIFNAAGAKVTGRAGVVTSNLQMDNAATGETVTVAESSAVAGVYQASFTPLATGTYRIDIIDPVYNAQGWFGSWEVLGSDDDSITAGLVTVQADLDDTDQYKATGFAVPNEYDAALTAIQLDLDTPDQYKATGFSVPNEYDVILAAIQSDLDNPNQYKADVTNLDVAVSSRAPANEYDAELTAIQLDLDTPDQYKANVALLALEATAQTLIADVAFIKSIEGGRWRIVGNQMLFYASDNVTEVARFNLLDSGGSPAMTDVMERTRV